MLQNVLIFILFLCPLILVHEIGHFIAAVAFGVKVEVFSIGFGPRLCTIKCKGTDFIISLIPFGGYVKMFGDDLSKKHEIAPELRSQSFLHQGKFAIFMITFMGPLFNFVLAYFLFFGLYFHGEHAPALRFGLVENTVFSEMGISAGDILYKINDGMITNMIDLPSGENEIIESVTVKRNEEEVVFSTNVTVKKFMDEFDKISPMLRTADMVNNLGVDYTFSPNEEITDGYSIDISQKLETGYMIGPDKYMVIIENNLVDDLIKQGFYPKDLVVSELAVDSPAKEAGINEKDIITEVNGKKITSFLQIKKEVTDSNGEVVKLRVLRNGKTMNFEITPIKPEGQDQFLIGIVSAGEYLPQVFLDFPSKGFWKSLSAAFFQLGKVSKKILEGLKKMITGEISAKQIGGPLAIGKVAADSFKTSIGYFLQIMALISINLGLLNLLPIPVLDGGYIMFIVLEIIKRGPLSDRQREISQIIGLIFILLLSAVAIFNDIYRIFVK